MLAGILVLVVALAPLVPWTYRNWKTFDHFQPLAPRYASDLDEFTPLGFNHWVRTWMAEYVSVEDIYWKMPGTDVDVNLLPSRAYDTPEEEARTRQLFADYETRTAIWPELDQQFEQLARRARRSSSLPLLRPIASYCGSPICGSVRAPKPSPSTAAGGRTTRTISGTPPSLPPSRLINLALRRCSPSSRCFLRPRPRYLFVVAGLPPHPYRVPRHA